MPNLKLILLLLELLLLPLKPLLAMLKIKPPNFKEKKLMKQYLHHMENIHIIHELKKEKDIEYIVEKKMILI